MQVLTSQTSIFHGDFLSRRFVTVPFGRLLQQWQVSAHASCPLRILCSTRCACTSQTYYRARASTLTRSFHPTCERKNVSHLQAGAASDGQLYLAQAPLNSSLAPLLCDLPTPAALQGVQLQSTNLWMNGGPSTSSLHYDPQHNLLCVVCGFKRVQLWPPACTRLLQPFSIYGESSNHSTLKNLHGCAELDAAAKFSGGRHFDIRLGAGDALYIPAGWWHLVHSDARTLAVNYWWPVAQTGPNAEHTCAASAASGMCKGTPQHMHVFFDRQRARDKAELTLYGSLMHCRQQLLQRVRSACKPAGRKYRASEWQQLRLLVATHCMQVTQAQLPCSGLDAPRVRQIQSDAIAMMLCMDAKEAVAVLCACVDQNAANVRCWLQSGMTSLCAECLTLLLEGGWDVPSASSTPPSASSEHLDWLHMPCDESWLDEACASLGDGQSTKQVLESVQGVTGLIAADVLFERVYPLVDAELLARRLSERKEALRTAAAQG